MSNASRPLIFGEVLFDCFPDGARVLGGAPFNVAWHCQAFGLAPLLVSRVGRDELGEQIIDAMVGWGMDTSGIQLDEDHATGVVAVQFKQGEPSYDIVADSAWDFIDPDRLPPVDGNGWLYHGSLALRQSRSAAALQQLKRTGRSEFVDINLRPPWWQLQQMLAIVDRVQFLKLNEHEIMQLVPEAPSVEQAMNELIDERAIQLLVVTRGAQGVMALAAQDEIVIAPPQQAVQVTDTVGAGDAFSSVLLLGQHLGWSLPDCLQRAQAFASAIVGIQGATINDKSFYQPFIADWQL